jgi:hypothetical protein
MTVCAEELKEVKNMAMNHKSIIKKRLISMAAGTLR